MILCKEVLENSKCGKKICCKVCEERETCKDVCTEVDKEGCTSAFEEEAAVTIMQNEAAELISKIGNIAVQKKQLEEAEKSIKEQLLKAMENYNVKKFESDTVTFTYIAESVSNQLDSKALKADLPDIANKYTKQVKKSAYVKIAVKK